MKYKWLIVFLSMVVAGCAVSPSATPLASTTLAAAPPTGTLAPTTAATPSIVPSATAPATRVLATLPATASPTVGAASQTRAPSPAATGAGLGAAATPTTIARVGWKTFVSASWNVAVDYPPDWSVREEPMGVTFSSAQGATVLLAPISTGGLPPSSDLAGNDLPNTRCRQITNGYGVAVRSCFDTIAFSYSADFVIQSSGGSRLFSLSTRTRLPATLQIFNAMIASVRPAS